MERIAEAHVVVSGLVQGVFFRASTREAAARHGVRGYVRNLPDGRVEAVIQGEEGAVRRVVEFMREGPPGARVTEHLVRWRVPAERLEGFHVRR